MMNYQIVVAIFLKWLKIKLKTIENCEVQYSIINSVLLNKIYIAKSLNNWDFNALQIK